MQHGSLIKSVLKFGPDVWQFRWSEKDPQSRRIYRRRVIGTVEDYRDMDCARRAVVGLLSEINSDARRVGSNSMTFAQLCSHFEQRELAKDNTWRSYSTKNTYRVYLKRWVVPHWGKYELSAIKTIQVESWLRRLPFAKSSCAKIRNVMSVLFNHACRYEFFDRSPICLVRQSAKRRTAPSVRWQTRDHDHLFPALIACNLAPVFNHGVLSLLCGGSSKHVFGSRGFLISAPKLPRLVRSRTAGS